MSFSQLLLESYRFACMVGEIGVAGVQVASSPHTPGNWVLQPRGINSLPVRSEIQLAIRSNVALVRFQFILAKSSWLLDFRLLSP